MDKNAAAIIKNIDTTGELSDGDKTGLEEMFKQFFSDKVETNAKS